MRSHLAAPTVGRLHTPNRDERGDLVALRPPPRRHLSSAFDQDNVGVHTHPEAGVGGTTATIVVDAHPPFGARGTQLLGADSAVVGTAASVAELGRLSEAAPYVRLVLIG